MDTLWTAILAKRAVPSLPAIVSFNKTGVTAARVVESLDARRRNR